MRETLRTCAVCGKKEKKSELLRLVVDELGVDRSKIVIDLVGLKTGRGAYCHLDDICLSAKCSLDRIVFNLFKTKKLSKKLSRLDLRYKEKKNRLLDVVITESLNEIKLLKERNKDVGIQWKVEKLLAMLK